MLYAELLISYLGVKVQRRAKELGVEHKWVCEIHQWYEKTYLALQPIFLNVGPNCGPSFAPHLKENSTE